MIKNLGDIYKGSSITYGLDWNNYLTNKGTTATTSTWSTNDSAVSLASDSLASGISSVQITGAQTGCAIVKNNVVFADGDDDFAYFKVNVVDPECEGSTVSDYD